MRSKPCINREELEREMNAFTDECKKKGVDFDDIAHRAIPDSLVHSSSVSNKPDDLYHRAAFSLWFDVPDEIDMEFELVKESLEKWLMNWNKVEFAGKLSRMKVNTVQIRNSQMYACKDCGGDTVSFVVKDDLWREQIAPNDPKCILCVSCIQRRIGRNLVLSDVKENCGFTKEVIQAAGVALNTLKQIVKQNAQD